MVLRTLLVLVLAGRHVKLSRRRAGGGDWAPPVRGLVPAYKEAVGIGAPLAPLRATPYAAGAAGRVAPTGPGRAGIPWVWRFRWFESMRLAGRLPWTASSFGQPHATQNVIPAGRSARQRMHFWSDIAGFVAIGFSVLLKSLHIRHSEFGIRHLQ